MDWTLFFHDVTLLCAKEGGGALVRFLGAGPGRRNIRHVDEERGGQSTRSNRGDRRCGSTWRRQPAGGHGPALRLFEPAIAPDEEARCGGSRQSVPEMYTMAIGGDGNDQPFGAAGSLRQQSPRRWQAVWSPP